MEDTDGPEANKVKENQPFDWKTAVAALAGQEEDGPGRKLTFFDQCQAFVALHNRIKTAIVAKAFGVSPVAAAQIKNCRTTTRYPRVAAEFRALGEDAFTQKYGDPELLARLAQAKYDVDDQSSRFKRGLPTMKADKKSFRTIGTFEIDSGEFWQVRWLGHKTKPELSGWYFTYCQSSGEPIPGDTWHWKGRGHEGGEGPFRTSGYAFNAAYAYCNRTPPK